MQRREARLDSAGAIGKTTQEDMLLVQSIQITDKFGFVKKEQLQQESNVVKPSANYENVFVVNDVGIGPGLCVNGIGKHKSNRHRRTLISSVVRSGYG